jgi:diguanylate cyclase (GGDEF)-like protein
MSREPLSLNTQKIRVCKYILLLSPFILALNYYRDIGLPTPGQTLYVNGALAIANPLAYVLIRRYGRPSTLLRYTLVMSLVVLVQVYAVELYDGQHIDMLWTLLMPFAFVFLGDQRVGVAFSLIGWSIGTAIYVGYRSFGVDTPFSTSDFAHVQGVFLIATFFSWLYEKDRSRWTTRIFDDASRDPLTGLLNRRAFGESVNDIVSDLRRRSGELSTFCLVVFDIDDFKTVNDELGHHAGDRVLREVADISSRLVRGADTLFRWGGEEFVVLLRDTDVRGGRIVAEKLRNHLHNSSICEDRKVTASFGVAEWTPGESAGEVFRRADDAMYEGKRLGKDRVVVDPGAVAEHTERA